MSEFVGRQKASLSEEKWEQKQTSNAKERKTAMEKAASWEETWMESELPIG
ncbi:hypothetical protein D3C77_691390 [compost metagenome]